MPFNCVSFILMYFVAKFGDFLLEKILENIWQWLVSDEKLKQVTTRFKLQMVIWYLNLLVNITKFPKN